MAARSCATTWIANAATWPTPWGATTAASGRSTIPTASSRPCGSSGPCSFLEGLLRDAPELVVDELPRSVEDARRRQPLHRRELPLHLVVREHEWIRMLDLLGEG